MKAAISRFLNAVGPLDWLVGLVLSWVVPLKLLWHGRVTYAISLVLWIIPILFVLPRFALITHPGSRRRRAVCWTTLYVVALGAFLDLVFGQWVLDFDPRFPTPYLATIQGLGRIRIPVEEFLFYSLGGLAIVLVYFWADEFWLAEYNVRRSRPLIPAPGYLLSISWMAAAWIGGLFVTGIVLKQIVSGAGFWIPIYFSFLIIAAFGPAVILFRAIKDFVNWQAFSFTAIYVLLTSLLWEVTLAIPQYWWRYQRNAMLGIAVQPWSHVAMFPIEALMVWFVVTFSCVLTYEAIKAYQYDSRSPRQRLIGPPPWAIGPWGARES